MTLPSLHLDSLELRETPTIAGSIDLSFAASGIFRPTAGDWLTALAVQPDEKIVAVGQTTTNNVTDFLAIRLNPDGSPDKSFGTDGRVVIDFTPMLGSIDDRATSVAVMADGRIVVAGRGGSPFPSSLVARLTPTGELDTTFSDDGLVSVAYSAGVGPSPYSGGMAVDAKNRILIAGTTWSGVGSIADLFRLTETGELDTTFATGGRLQTPAPGMDIVESNAVAALPDGTIAWTGTTKTVGGRGNGFVGGWTRRLNDDGTSAPGLSGRGATRGLAVIVTPDGSILAAGDHAPQLIYTIPPGPANFAVSRWLADGTADPAFGTNGYTNIDLGSDDSARALTVDAAGRVIVVGSSTTDFPVIRLNADGTPDDAFNAALGMADYTRLGNFSATGVALQGDNIVVIGNAGIVRLLGEQTLDSVPLLAVSGVDGAVRLHEPTNGTYAPTVTVTPFFGFNGSVRAATADVNGDGVLDLVAVTGPGTPIRVAVLDGKNNAVLVNPFDPFGGDFTGGGFVTAADLDHDGYAEFAVTPDQGGGPRVTVFSWIQASIPESTAQVLVKADFFGIDDASFRGGARATFGDINKDGTPDLVVSAGFQGGPRTSIFDGTTLFSTPSRLVSDFYAFPGSDATTLRNGVFVASGDVDGDGFADLVFGGGPGGAPRVFILSGAQIASGDVAGAQAAPIANFFVAGNSTDRGGVRLAVKDADGDNKADVVAGSGEGSRSNVRIYLGKDFTSGGEPATFQDIDPFGGTLPGGVFVG